MSADSGGSAKRRALAERHLILALRVIKAHRGDLIYSHEASVGPDVRLIVSVFLPGVLRVFSCETGELLAESAIGEMLTLAPDFAPTFPKTPN